jgi:hypothetical protein
MEVQNKKLSATLAVKADVEKQLQETLTASKKLEK